MLPNCNKQLCHFWNYLFLYIKNEDWHLNFDFKNLKKKGKLFYDEYLGSKFKKSWILCWGGGWIVVRDLSFTTTTTTILDIFFVLLFIYSVSLADLPGAICCTKIHGKKEEKCFIFLVNVSSKDFLLRDTLKSTLSVTNQGGVLWVEGGGELRGRVFLAPSPHHLGFP